MNFDRIFQQLNRARIYFTDNPVEVMIELLAIWVLVLIALRFLAGTRGARVIKGVMLVLICTTLVINVFGDVQAFSRLQFLYQNFLEMIALALVIIFAPEIRRAMVRLGEARFFRGGGLRKARVIEEVLGALTYLSQNKIGALIAFERQVGLRGIIEAGTKLDAEVSQALLNTLFWPGSALHDMGLIIRGDRAVAAGVQFPLAENEQISKELGSRHRAAVGLSGETDALVLVVSEETGSISVAERGRLQQDMQIDDVRKRLIEGLGQTQMPLPSEDPDNADTTNE